MNWRPEPRPSGNRLFPNGFRFREFEDLHPAGAIWPLFSRGGWLTYKRSSNYRDRAGSFSSQPGGNKGVREKKTRNSLGSRGPKAGGFWKSHAFCQPHGAPTGLYIGEYSRDFILRGTSRKLQRGVGAEYAWAIPSFQFFIFWPNNHVSQTCPITLPGVFVFHKSRWAGSSGAKQFPDPPHCQRPSFQAIGPRSGFFFALALPPGFF